MTTKEQLILLLYQIRGAASPLQKLKLAALAWRTLRGLSQHDRLVVAKELGLGGAEHLVEQLGNRGGLSPAALLTAIRRAEEADPEELRELLGGVMDPARRDELLAGALQSAGGWLAEQEGVVVDELSEATSIPVVAGEECKVPFEIGPAVFVKEVAKKEPEPAPEKPGPIVPPVPVETPAPVADPPPEAPPAPDVPQSPQPVSHSAPWRPVAKAPVRDQAGSVHPVALAGRLLALSSPLARLRLLTSHVGDLRDMGIDELAQVIEVFPRGWSRRRALVGLLQSGIPADLKDALELVRRTADGGSWLWALSALAGRPGLDEAEKQMVEAAAKGFPALERRVAIRLGI